MEGAGTTLNIMILDACRNNPFGGRGLRAAAGGLAQMQAPEGTLLVYATQPGSVAMDGADGNSPFTKALAQTLRTPGLDLFRLFNEVGLQVKRTTAGAQQPWVSNSPIDGEFYIAGRVSELRKEGSAQVLNTQEQHVLSMDPMVRTAAERLRIPLPEKIPVSQSDPTSKFADYIGAWVGESGWDGTGRQIMVIVTSVDAVGRVEGVYGYGPPRGVQTPPIRPATAIHFTATIDQAGIKFFTGIVSLTFRLVNRTSMQASVEKDGRLSTQELHRLK